MKREPNQYHLVVFDPGGTIGWAHFVVNFKAFSRPESKVLRYVEGWNCGEFIGTEDEQIGHAVALIHRARYGSIGARVARTDVVAEDFELTQLIGGRNLLSPVRINAVIDWECKRQFGLQLILQKRQMRTSVTKERLRLFGFDRRFGKDEFSAMQHAVVWLRRVKEKSKSLPWKFESDSATNAKWDCSCEVGRKCNLNHPK